MAKQETGELLLAACAAHDIPAAVSLLKKGANVNYQDEDGVSPLMKAVGSPQLVRILCKYGANVTLKDNKDRSPLSYAIMGDEGLQLFEDYSSDSEDDDTVSGIVSKFTSKQELVETIKVLLEHGAKVDSQDDDPLVEACFLGHTETVKLLIDHGAPVYQQNGMSLLMIASAAGHSEIVQLLLHHGVKVDLQTDGVSALMAAIEEGHEETVKVLLDHGAQVDLKDNQGETALEKAKKKGRSNIEKLLLTHKADQSTSRKLSTQHAKKPQLSSQLPNEPATLEMQKATMENAFQRLQTTPTITLKHALEFTLPMASVWHNMGVLLEVDDGTLQTIDHDYRRAHDCLRQMLREWLKQVHPRPTWEALAKAVEPFDPTRAQTIRSM